MEFAMSLLYLYNGIIIISIAIQCLLVLIIQLRFMTSLFYLFDDVLDFHSNFKIFSSMTNTQYTVVEILLAVLVNLHSQLILNLLQVHI